MKQRDQKTLTLVAGVVLAGFAGLLIAQDDPAVAAETGVAAEDAVAPQEAAEPTAPPVKPRPSEIMALTPNNLLLDVANTGKHLIAVGDRGSIIASNNGKDWAQVETPVRSPLTAVSFADENNGWAVGHDAVILKTGDSGKSWQMQNFQPELEKAFLDVIAIDASTVFAVGAYGLLYGTSDGGTTWAEIDAPDIRGEELHFNAAARLGDASLLVVGEQGMIGHSSDGGQSWSKLSSPYDGSFYGALPIGATGAMLFGLRGNVLTTQNVSSGQWQAVDTGTVSSFFGGTSLADGGAALVGLAGKVLLLDPSGVPKTVKVKIKAIDANGNETDKEVTGSYSSAIAFAGGLLLVGEEGVQSIKLN